MVEPGDGLLVPQTDFGAPADAWTGSWISAAGPPPPGMHRAAFRAAVVIGEVPVRLPLRISADARYVFWVNGTEIGRGPVRSQPWRWAYDEYDIARELRPGVNELAVLVTYYGADNAVWQRARVHDGLGAQASLIIDAPAPWRSVATGEHWHAAVQTAWSTVPTDGILAGLPIEILDMRGLDPAWAVSAAYRESLPAAARAAATHLGSGRRSTPPVHPFGPLHPRSVAMPTGPRVSASSVTVTAAPRSEPSGDPVADVHAAAAASSAACDGRLAATADDDSVPLWTFDFGRIVGGFFEIDVVAPPGTVIDLAYLEHPIETGRSRRHTPRAGARVVTAEGRTRFRALEWNGMRYALALLRPPQGGTVELASARVREYVYPFEGDATFRASDPDLSRLWHAGLRTVQLNSVDAFTDCPTREQRAWVGDPVVHAEVHLVANEDWRLIRRHLELADSPRPDGLLPMAVSCDVEAAGGYTIPDWSLHWIHALWLYARASRDADFVRRRMATAGRIVDWFSRYANDHGILVDVPEWSLADWSSVFTDGPSSILTALWARALEEYAELADWMGYAEESTRARAQHGRVQRGFEAFWDPARSLYVDHLAGDASSGAVSQAANAAAIVAGLVPADREAGLVARITDETRLVTRGWHVASPTLTLEEKLADRAAGRRRIDWDVEREIVRAEPFFSSVVHDAVARAGRADLLPSLVKRWMRFLDDGYDTFGECWEWGTPCHGWSSTPTRDLVRLVLGARPGPFRGPAFTIAPARTDVEWMTAVVPTRDGPVRIEVRGATLRVDASFPVEVRRWSGATLTLPAGEHRIALDG